MAEIPASVGARLDAVKSVQNQIRFTLAAMAVISMMMVIASYNAYLSYDSDWTLRHANDFLGRGGTDVMTEQGLKNWVDSRNVQIALVGIRVAVDDAPILGTASLLLLGLWLVLLTRSENQAVGLLLRDTAPPVPRPEAARSAADRADDEIRRLIAHTIDGNSPFVNFDHSIERISTLSPRVPQGQTTMRGRIGARVLTLTTGFFFFFPVVAFIFVAIVDRSSYFVRSPFDPAAVPLGTADPFFWRSLWLMVPFGIALAVCCKRAQAYSAATERVLREYRGHLGAG